VHLALIGLYFLLTGTAHNLEREEMFVMGAHYGVVTGKLRLNNDKGYVWAVIGLVK